MKMLLGGCLAKVQNSNELAVKKASDTARFKSVLKCWQEEPGVETTPPPPVVPQDTFPVETSNK